MFLCSLLFSCPGTNAWLVACPGWAVARAWDDLALISLVGMDRRLIMARHANLTCLSVAVGPALQRRHVTHSDIGHRRDEDDRLLRLPRPVFYTRTIARHADRRAVTVRECHASGKLDAGPGRIRIRIRWGGGARSLIYGYAAPTRTTSAFACHVREEFVLKSFLVSIGLI